MWCAGKFYQIAISTMSDDEEIVLENAEEYDEEVLEISVDYDLEPDEAEEVQSIVEELGVDIDDAVMIHEAL